LNDFTNQDVKKYFPKLYSKIKVILIEAFPRILNVFDEKMSSYATNSLQEGGTEVLCNAMVTKVSENVVDIKLKGQENTPKKLTYGTLVVCILLSTHYHYLIIFFK
jgi:NADH:ubiquinone reductase (non-electrogenic)